MQQGPVNWMAGNRVKFELSCIKLSVCVTLGGRMMDDTTSMRYRERAVDMHKRAANEKDGELRASYLVLARDWLKLADNGPEAEISTPSN